MEEKRQKKEKRRWISALMILAVLLACPRALAAERVDRLVPVGRSAGVKLFSEGVLVVELSADSGTPYSAREAGIKVGDLLLRFNGETISSAEHLQRLLSENGDAAAVISLQRGSGEHELTVTPRRGTDGVYRLGAWVRDSMAGIGTVTFYDPESGVFGALGHPITDVDTGQLMPLARGAVMSASVRAVKPGRSGVPGELRGDFDLTHDIGTLDANTSTGVFGRLTDPAAASDWGGTIPVAQHGEIAVGAAEILCTVSGTQTRAYAAEIEKIYAESSPSRSFLLRVTDPALLAVTGGIVQGMSGSPVVQNGKFVGAVTHVLVDNPERGYGILIEKMLADAGIRE